MLRSDETLKNLMQNETLKILISCVALGLKNRTGIRFCSSDEEIFLVMSAKCVIHHSSDALSTKQCVVVAQKLCSALVFYNTKLWISFKHNTKTIGWTILSYIPIQHYIMNILIMIKLPNGQYTFKSHKVYAG